MKKFFGSHIIPILRLNAGYYLAGAFLILGLKCYSQTANADSLRWILAPTAWWAGFFGGISFEYLPGAGYVNHSIKFLIAPSCAGLRFLTLSFAMLLFSFLHRTARGAKKIAWVSFSLLLSYVTAVFANGIRIALSIHLPPLLLEHSSGAGWLTHESLHTMTGVFTYLTALALLYRTADLLSGHLCFSSPREVPLQSARAWLLPVFWYLFFLLGIPLMTGSWPRDPAGFAGYALLLLLACCALLLLASVGILLLRLYKGKLS